MIKEHTAKACGKGLPISIKQSIEICNFIRSKELQKSKKLLQQVIGMKIPIPFKRFTAMGHRKGNMAAGRYPIKACTNILHLLESAEANAQFKGLNTSSLIIDTIIPNKGAKAWHYGRQRRRQMKRTNIDIILKEVTSKETPKKSKEIKKDPNQKIIKEKVEEKQEMKPKQEKVSK